MLEFHPAHRIRGFDVEGVRTHEFRVALNEIHFALLRQQHQAVGQSGDHFILPKAQTIAVDLRRAKDDTVLPHIGGFFDDLGGVQQGL